jgi:hypothetical protein
LKYVADFAIKHVEHKHKLQVIQIFKEAKNKILDEAMITFEELIEKLKMHKEPNQFIGSWFIEIVGNQKEIRE